MENHIMAVWSICLCFMIFTSVTVLSTGLNGRVAPGAVSGDRTKGHTAWDINYFTMGFEGFESGAIGKPNGSNFDQSDACLIRVVYTK